jgi:hypothetical protein
MAVGPYITFQYQDADSMTRSFCALGIRGVFYTAP